ncbi:MAG: 2-C-methyl-D-erythritol 4-phosphate cytidylyltransferase [Acidobacteria bacterium]|nr:2-C-methyl-D-erythritol 4-phosphate cytidylyltransferase [Acidobacteriota bacterium]
MTSARKFPSMHVTAIIAAAGAGRRLAADVPKQMLEVGGQTILQRSVAAFTAHPRVTDVIVVLPNEVAADPPAWLNDVRVVTGGTRRQDSVAAGVDALRADAEIVLIHDAARPFVSAALISRAIDAAATHGAAIAAVPVTDTVKRVQGSEEMPAVAETLARDTIYLAQTPQAFTSRVIREAVALGRSGVDATDESALAERAGHSVRIVPGEPGNVKITTAADLDAARRSLTAMPRVGTGYDLHRLVDARPLVLGGVTVPSERGALGHSDADVICHAVTDAVLGAAGAGDIGRHYPDTDGRWKDAFSLDLLRDAVQHIRRLGFAIENVDVTVLLERPRISAHVAQIAASLASALGVEPERVSVKGKTNEGMDAIGRGEAIAAHAVALLRRA